MKSLKIFFWFIILNAFVSCTNSNPKIESPNILFILVDDLGYNDLSVMGSQYYETPNIDHIASQGINFTNGYATCAVCSPSRASLLTGKFAARHGITDWIGAKSGEAWRANKRFTQLLPAAYVHQLSSEFQTFPEVLQENGYHTFFAGKWHLGKEGSHPEDHGFDINKGGYHVGGPYSGGFFSPFNNPKMEDFPDEKGMSLSMKLAKETSKFIKENKDTKFLAYLSFYAVHAPIQTSEDKWKKYRNKADSLGVLEKGFAIERRLPYRLKQDNPVYAGLIEQVDEAVGVVMKTLKDLNLDENTIVVFTSDNGGVTSGDNYSTNLSPLRGGKGYQWEGGIRVPYFISVPWMKQDGKINTTPVSGADFYPTILDLAGIDLRPEEHQDGLSLVPLLENKNIEERALYWHYPHYGNQGGDPSSIIREGNWKLIHYWEDSKNELYDLSKDLGEQKDVSDAHLEITNRLDLKLKAWLTSVKANYPSPDDQYHPDTFKMKNDAFVQNKLLNLETQRSKMLAPDWQPNDDWWGSRITED